MYTLSSGLLPLRSRHIVCQTDDVAPQKRPKKMLGNLELLTLLNLIPENHGIYLYEIQTNLSSLELV